LATISSIAKIRGTTLETQTPELTQKIEAATIAGATFKPPPLEYQHPETTRNPEYLEIGATMMAEGNVTLTTQNVDTLAPVTGNRGGLLGSVPACFKGDRATAKEFMWCFEHW
jgi:hypothetical protein